MKKIYFLERNILLWLLGSTLSSFGDVFTSTAIPLVTFNLTNSAQFSALVLMLDLLPSILLSPLIGIMVDKYSKKNIVFISNIFSIIILLSFIFINQYEWYYLIGNSLISISAKFYSTAAKTMLPQIVEDNNIISRVNSLISLTLKISRILGASLAAVVLGLWGTNFLFVFDSISFIINAICVLGLHLKKENIKPNDHQGKSYSFISIGEYLRKDKVFLVMCSLYMCLFFLEGLMQSQMVVFIKQYLFLDDIYYAFYQNCLLIGVVLGQLVFSRYEVRKRELSFEKLGIMLISCSLIGIFLFKQVIFGALYGFGQPLIVTAWYSYFYKHTPADIRGRLLAFTNMCFGSLNLLGVVIIYFICNYFSPPQIFLFMALVFFLLIFSITIYERCQIYEAYRTKRIFRK